MTGHTRGGESGSVGASGGSTGSAASRTARRARQRARRAAKRRWLINLSQHNPPGSKLLRRFAKAMGIADRSQDIGYREAREHYAQRVEPTYRAGESKRRIAAGTAW